MMTLEELRQLDRRLTARWAAKGVDVSKGFSLVRWLIRLEEEHQSRMAGLPRCPSRRAAIAADMQRAHERTRRAGAKASLPAQASEPASPADAKPLA